jgi:diaminohydroxyphosphoribosylaminopyrimidine deaminase/5-amino-6-(5-phosphoribosylamino)uracil reductase
MLIHQKGIPRVVISNTDPFLRVNGLGIKQMQESGIQVEAGCLSEEGTYLNRRFLVYHQNKRPYVVLKWAQTMDGFIDLVREPEDPIGTNWITDDVSRTLVHKWRSEEAAIMVGTNTVLTDNPMLNIRRWTGDQPVRVTVDRNGRLPGNSYLLDGSQDTIVFTGNTGKFSGKSRSIKIDPSYDLSDLLDEMHGQKIISVLVEGGASLHSSFLDSGLWDEARIFTGKMSFSQGIPAPELKKNPDETLHFHDTKLEIYRNDKNRVH